MQVRHRGDLSTSPAAAPGERSARRQMLTFHRYAPSSAAWKRGRSQPVVLLVLLVPASGTRPAHSDRQRAELQYEGCELRPEGDGSDMACHSPVWIREQRAHESRARRRINGSSVECRPQ